MRGWLVPGAMLVVGSCLGAPTGASTAWPPAGVDVVAVTTGDVDGDGTADAIVVSAGSANSSAGVYLLRGGAGYLPALPPPLRAFSAFTPLPIAAPASVAISTVSGVAVIAVAYKASDTGSDVVQLLVGDELVASAGPFTQADALGNGGSDWVQFATFPGAQTHLVFDFGPIIQHSPISVTGTTASITPMSLAPGSNNEINNGWSAQPLGILTQGSAFAVATKMYVATGTLSSPPSFAATNTSWGGSAQVQGLTEGTVSSSGSSLVVLAALDSMGDLCVVDPQTGSSGACATSSTGTIMQQAVNASSTAYVGSNLVGNMPGGIAVVGAAGSVATVVGYPSLTYAPNAPTLMTAPGMGGSDAMLPTLTSTVKNALSTLASDGVLLVGSDGESACVAFDTSTPGGGTCSGD